MKARTRERPTTICAHCAHFVHLETTGPRAGLWYNHLCAAPPVQRPKSVDPVTGGDAYFGHNDLGGRVNHGRPEPFCRDVNDGHCPHFRSTRLTLAGES